MSDSDASPPAPPPTPARAHLELQAVRAALRGDGAALGHFLESYRPRLARMIALRMDVRLRGRLDVHDVLQESFAGILERLEEFVGKRMGLFLWVRLETGEKLAELHRFHLGTLKRDAGHEVPLVLGGVPGASSIAIASAILDGTPSPSRAAMRREAEEYLLAALESMKEIDREVLALRHFEQLGNREVAELLGLSEPGATLRYVRAIKRLRTVLADLELTSEALHRQPRD